MYTVRASPAARARSNVTAMVLSSFALATVQCELDRGTSVPFLRSQMPKSLFVPLASDRTTEKLTK